jgi:glycosyltransferase involved in cell wall biosynthesis
VFDLRQSMFDGVLPAAQVEHMRHVDGCWTIRGARRECELNAGVGQNGVDLVWKGSNQGFLERGSRRPACPLRQLNESKIARAINGDVEVELSLRGLDLGDVDVEIADRISLELLPGWLVAFDIGQPFVLFVSTIESRRNHLLAFNTWLKLIKKWGLAATPTLVCVGKSGWMADVALACLESSDVLKQKVIMLSKSSDVELAALYRTCLLTIYPSFYEGWGLPVTEALCYGKVPLSSSVSSLPEAGGVFAEYFDIESERDFLEKLERLIFDPKYWSKKEEKIKTSFKPREWDEIAAEIVTQTFSVAAKRGCAHFSQ